jgi:hypothetical protein
MTTRLTLLAVIGALLALPAGASAGGWATVGLDLPPRDLAPGEPWEAELTVLQHGVTPLEGVQPRVIVQREGGGNARAFAARTTGEPGVYRASVVFASAGTWTYKVDDDFSAEHSFPAVVIGKSGSRTEAAADGEGDAALAAGGKSGPGGGSGHAAAVGGGRIASAGDDGPDYLLAIGAAAVAALAAGLGAAALQRRRGGPSPAGG